MFKFTAFTTIIIACLFSASSFAQEHPSYLISIQHKADKIILECAEGCNWEELSFIKPSERAPQAIGKEGMVKGSAFTTGDDHPYFFTIYEKDNYMYLKGGNDNGFTKLGFTLKEQKIQWIDQDGMRLSKNEQ